MGISLQSLRNTIITSIYGRRAGLTKDEYLVGPKDIQTAVEDIQTTVATTVLGYGHTRNLTSGSSQLGQHTIPAPTPGVRKVFSLQSTSTGNQQYGSTANGAAIYAASGSTVGWINLQGAGARVELMGVTTALWMVLSGTTIAPTNVTHTTST